LFHDKYLLRFFKDKYLFSKPLSQVTSENILPAIKQYCEENEISLTEAITSLDKRKDFCLSIPEFLAALQVILQLYC